MTRELAPEKFIRQIKIKMEEQDIGIRELARKLGVSHPTVSGFVTYGYRPSFDTCTALAKWLEQSQETTLREAGLLPPGPPDRVTFNDWKEMLSDLSERDRAILKKTALNMIEADEKTNEKTKQNKAVATI